MRVVINMQQDGCFHVVTDEPCEVYCVNDNCTTDRVYLLTISHTVGRAAVDAELRDDVPGSALDERHAAIENRIVSWIAGKPHLKPVT